MKEIIFNPEARFLLVRPDKIGDVILTTPAIADLRKAYPKAFIAFLCRSYAAPVLENNPHINEIISFEEEKTSSFSLARRIKSYHFGAAIHFYLDNHSVASTLWAGIPVRVGPFSKMAAFFLSHRLVQHRSKVEKHEAEYNLELTKACGASGEPSIPAVYLNEAEKKKGKEILNRFAGSVKTKPILIHPGSAGSVQNWPLDSFIELAGKLSSRHPVIFTGGKGEEGFLKKAREASIPNSSMVPAGALSLRELACLISQARLVISNSTGPLHMAVALGVPTLSFYPHLPKVTSAQRWGPFGDPQRNRVLFPAHPSDSMRSISAESAFWAAEAVLNQNH